MPICTKCRADKPEDQFFFKNRATGRRHSQCKACYKAHRAGYQREHYEKYKPAYLARAAKRNARVLAELRGVVLERLKRTPCPCGESDPVVLDFHHTDPDVKVAAISAMLSAKVPLAALGRELAVCEVLCANCHRRATAGQQNWWKS